MRNLKRVLSLVLAAMMLIGMMVIGASAAVDKGDVSAEYGTAIDVAVAMGVITGDNNGVVNPTQTLKRSEAAVMITRLVEGPDKAYAIAEKYATLPNSYTDSDGWSDGYINYCIENGYLAGRGNGIVDPNGPLKVEEFGIMVLRVLGYVDAYEGFSGSNWDRVVAVKMINLGLDLEDVNFGKQLTREQASQMILQALSQDMITYTVSTQFDASGNVIGVTYTPKTRSNTGNEEADDPVIKEDGILQLGEKLGVSLTTADTDEDPFNRPATIWSVDGKAVAEEPTEADATYTKPVTLDDIAKDLGVKADKLNYTAGSDYTVDAVGSQTADGSKTAPLGGYGVTTYVYATKNADDASKYDIKVISVTDYLAKVTKVTEAKGDNPRSVELTVFGLQDSESTLSDVKINYETNNYAENDYLIVNVAIDSKSSVTADSCEVIPVGAATIVENVAVTRYNTEDQTLTAGKAYTYAETLTATYESGGKAIDLTKAFDDGQTYTFYTNADGIILGGETYTPGKATPTDYLYVITGTYKKAGEATPGATEFDEDKAATDPAARITALFTDGTVKVVDLAIGGTAQAPTVMFPTLTEKVDGSLTEVSLKKDAADEKSGNQQTIGWWFAYEVNEDGEYTLTALSESKVATVEDKSSEALTVTKGEAIKLGDKYSTSSTKVTVLTKGKGTNYDVSGYVGLPTEDAAGEVQATILYIYDKNLITAIYYVGDSVEPEEDPGVPGYAYAISGGDEVNGGTEWTFAIGGEQVTYVISKGDIAKGSVYTLEASKDVKGTYEATAVATSASDNKPYVHGDTGVKVTVADTAYFAYEGDEAYYAKDVEVYNVSKSAKVAGETGTIKVNDYVIYINVGGTGNNADQAQVIYIVDAPQGGK